MKSLVMVATISSITLAISGTSPWEDCGVLREGAIVHWHTGNHLVRLDKIRIKLRTLRKTQRKLSGRPSPQT